MAGPTITRWPGGPQGGEVPLSAMMAMSGRVPMFDSHQGPRYTGPFNAGGDYGSMLQLVMPQIMQMMMGSEHMPAQFFPEQNLHDQMEANKYLEASQSAMQTASRRDTGTIESMLAGLTQMMTKQPLTEIQQARNTRIAGGISSFMPILSQVLGPDLVDQLHGSRGSATVFAQQMHQALRTSIDPITHTAGYSGESAGRITQDVFEQLFGPKSDIGMLKGMSAGQAGILVNELQSRGMLGQPIGVLPLQEQRSLLPKELSSDTVNRLAEQLPEIKKILQANGTPDDDMLAQARATIRSTHQRLVDPTVKLDQDELEQLPGGQEIIRTGDAARISSRLKNLSGAVKAMRDIFGDMGNPNAPMREIINGLEALTQGGLSTMSPGQLEMMVRKTHTIAKQTGIGVEGMMALTSQNAALADQLGLDRTFAVTAAQQAATFGAAAGDRLRLDLPAWGAQSKEQLLLNDQQLRMHAAASPLANQLNAVMRMADTGMAAPAEGTELAAFTSAVRQGKTTYDFGGKKRDIVMPHAQLIKMLERDAGVRETEAYAVLSDITGNQEFGQLHNTTDTVRRVQVDETARRMLTPTIGNRVRGMLHESGIDEILQAEGITRNETDFREMMNRIGEGVGQDFLKLDPAVVRSTVQKRQALGASFRTRLTAEVQAKMPNAGAAEVTAVVDGLVNQMGGDQGMEKMGTALHATINQTAAAHPTFKSDVNMHNLLNMPTLEQGAARDRQAEMSALTQSALAGLGTADPVRRLSDVFQNATHETTLQEALTSAMGGVSVDAIKAADPNGGLAKVFGLIKENNKLDANDPKQLDQARRNVEVMKGLIEGGDVALDQIRKLDATRTRIGPADVDKATPAQQATAIAELEAADQRQRKTRDAKLTNQQTRLTETATRLTRIAEDKVPAAELADEKRMATGAVRAMAESLGKEEIALGGNRFLTRRGVVTKNDTGEIQSIAGFEDTATAQETLGVFQQRHAATMAEAKQADAAAAAQPAPQKLGRAAELGLLRGDLTTGNEALRRQLEQASQRDSNTSLLGDLGYQLSAKVSIDQTQATHDSGNLADQVVKEKKDTAEARSAVSTFVLGSRERGRQLLEDERSMHIIGRGGLELVRGAMEGSDKLQAMADVQSKKLNRKVEISQLLWGGAGITDEVRQEANETFQSTRTQWAEIARLRKFGMQPGKGDDPLNKKRAAMTPQEEEDLEAQQSFTKEFTTAETRAAEVLDRLANLATPEQKARMTVDTNRKQLLEAITQGDRGVALNQAIHGREELLQMGLRKGLFKGKTRVNELTDEEENTAAEKLNAMQLSEDERADFERLRRVSAPLMDFGMRGMNASDITQDALRRIQQSATTQAPNATNGQDKPLKVTVTGTVTQRNDGLVDLSLEGSGIMDQVSNALGMA